MIIEGFELVHGPGESDGAEVIGDVIGHSAPIIRDMWPFPQPRGAKVIVWTDWMDGYRRGLPRLHRMLLPLWRKRIARYGDALWKVVGGVTLQVRPPAVLVKPPRLLAEADVRIGEQLYTRLEDINQKVGLVACHELVHAFSAKRHLPAWLNEGIAMVTVDRFLGFESIKPETLDLLGPTRPPIRSYRRLHRLGTDELVQLYARGYWITRYLNDQHPDSLRRLLARRWRTTVTDRSLAVVLGLKTKDLWSNIDSLVVDHYR